MFYAPAISSPSEGRHFRAVPLAGRSGRTGKDSLAVDRTPGISCMEVWHGMAVFGRRSGGCSGRHRDLDRDGTTGCSGRHQRSSWRVVGEWRVATPSASRLLLCSVSRLVFENCGEGGRVSGTGDDQSGSSTPREHSATFFGNRLVAESRRRTPFNAASFAPTAGWLQYPVDRWPRPVVVF